MGKGDKKTGTGKRFMGSYGVTRKKNKNNTNALAKTTDAESSAEPAKKS